MRYFSNSLTITELSKSETAVESTGLALLSKYILQVIGHFNITPGGGERNVQVICSMESSQILTITLWCIMSGHSTRYTCNIYRINNFSAYQAENSCNVNWTDRNRANSPKHVIDC